MIYAVAIWLVTLIIDLWTDLRRWTDGKGINHVRGALLRCIGLIPACYLAGWFSGVLLTSYWILFQGLLARLKGLPFWYVGSTAWSDRMIRRLPGKWAYIAMQVVLMAVAIIVYIKRPG